MADMVMVVPDLDCIPFRNILPSLEKSGISCADLLTIGPSDVSKRAHIPLRDVKHLMETIDLHLQSSLCATSCLRPGPDKSLCSASVSLGKRKAAPWSTISTLDEDLDHAIGGGFPSGYLSEITGESGAGKTQLLLTLLLSVQLPAPLGLGRSAVYVSTEAVLQTRRVIQILQNHPKLAPLSNEHRPSLSRIFSIQIPDLEAQDHILRYQLPVLIEREHIGLVVVDSVAANYRAEFESHADLPASAEPTREHSVIAKRSAHIVKLGTLLRLLAEETNAAVVVANQVSDRFDDEHQPKEDRSNCHTATTVRSEAGPQWPSCVSTTIGDRLSLEHQQRWFTGWGKPCEDPSLVGNLKTPSLGLVWANQLACRVVLRRVIRHSRGSSSGRTYDRPLDDSMWRRSLSVAFASWSVPALLPWTSTLSSTEFRITQLGISVVRGQELLATSTPASRTLTTDMS